MATLVIRVPAAQMALFKAIIESYDNLATLRTEDPAEERLKLWFSPETKEDIESLLRSLAPAISVQCLGQD
jgi:hypothetical protein